ncbi:MAG: DUF4168 domain-containing protein [Symploca sp. SIO1B1]|nr:DUF4168 domain-containing protein [Symploca sp. SIO2D2]NER45780.1 DUF4168 domain-containing protein [Symploca sp. SIO1A3]NER97787.1 DUF4168 domain-containing protein [Symploca sp. SIO1B1]
MHSYFFRPSLNRIFSQSLMVGVLAAIGVLSGIAPELSQDSQTLVFSSSAYAQATANKAYLDGAELERFVRASIRMEIARQQAYEDIQQNNGGKVPDIADCSLVGLSGVVRDIWENFCRQSERYIREEGFSNERYNEILRMRQQDPKLEIRIQQELDRQIKLQ